MITIKATIDDKGRVIFPQNEMKPDGYIGCHIDDNNFYFFFNQEEMDLFFNNLNSDSE
jgi:hypothetical protein